MTRHWIFLIWSVAVLNGAAASESAHSKRGSASAPLLDAAAAQNAGLDAQTLAAARKLYTTKCMRCHKSYEPAAYPQPQWDLWMVKMRKKARLSPEQDGLLSRYLDVYRATSSLARTNLSDFQHTATSDDH